MVSAELDGRGLDLSHKQTHALAGRWYSWKTSRHAEEPGAPQRWAGEIGALVQSLPRLRRTDGEAILGTGDDRTLKNMILL